MHKAICFIAIVFCLNTLTLAQETEVDYVESSRMARIEMSRSLGIQLRRLIPSSPVGEAAAREVFGHTLSEVGGILSVSSDKVSNDVEMIKLAVMLDSDYQSPDGEPHSNHVERFLDLTLENLHDVLSRTHEQIHEEHARSAAEWEDRLEENRQMAEELRMHARELRSEAGTVVLSLDEIYDRQQHLEREVFDLRLESEVSEAMRVRLSERIARAANEASEQLQQDETLAALGDLLALKEEALSRVLKKFEAGHASGAELGSAKADIAEQRVRIAERRDHLMRGSNGGLLEDLNAQLNSSLLESDRLEAMLQAYRRQLEQMQEKDLINLAEQYEAIQEQLRDAQDQVRNYKERLMKLRFEEESMTPPRIIVIE